ncbi:MAG: D-glycero-alpha-D-manno-heptose-1,7-bisphosphate 7-phosphatase [Planctomycetota bacterium]|jgi:D-glycero-D-manno-heptose 1,7-bisphosphate phosphatase
MKTAAIFLDRDGTIMTDTGYVRSPDEVRLLPGSAHAIRRLSEAGFLVVLASNQSGIARGLFGEEELEHVHEQLEKLLADHGATLDGAYYCPYLDGPKATVKEYRRDSELRKPKPGMLLQAARELNVDLKKSWMIGDKPSDVEAGQRAGCKTVFLANGSAGDKQEDDLEATHVVGSLQDAANAILGESQMTKSNNVMAADAENADRVLETLNRIQETLDRAQRPKRQDDFSLLRLGGALLQMFAIVVALWGAGALFDDRFPAAAARLALACFLQLASVSTFAIDRFR